MRAIDADAISYESIDSCDTGRHEHYYGTGIIAVRKEDIDAMPTIQPEPYWIPVTERLPEEYCECLVTYRTVDTQEFMDILEYEPSYEFDYEKGRFKGEWLFATDDERFTDGEVIAWMPLPESFKGVTE